MLQQRASLDKFAARGLAVRPMTYEDKTLTCVECTAEFVFSAGEQEFFDQRGLNAPPKRCAACRKALKERGRKPGRRAGGGEYRSPAFQGSAPEHQGGRRPGGGASRKNRDYRSPAFRAAAAEGGADYRAPAFVGIDTVDPEDEYRAPGFKEHENLKPEEEYRAPGFSEYKARWRDERPMFSVTCAACGQQSMVPFLPEEKERPLCTACHKIERDAARAAAETARAAELPASEEKPSEAASEPPDSAPEFSRGDE
jgi:CxxC-x17-CxxC domain-containing protein